MSKRLDEAGLDPREEITFQNHLAHYAHQQGGSVTKNGNQAPNPRTGRTEPLSYVCASSRIWRTGCRPSRLAVA